VPPVEVDGVEAVVDVASVEVVEVPSVGVVEVEVVSVVDVPVEVSPVAVVVVPVVDVPSVGAAFARAAPSPGRDWALAESLKRWSCMAWAAAVAALAPPRR
jgi:hypothetical protein